MKLNELPSKVQERLSRERIELFDHCVNTPYLIHLYNEDGTRYLSARRCCMAWGDNKGNYMPFGGGSYWTIQYGVVQFHRYVNPVGEIEYELCDGKTYGKSVNGTIIPRRVETKKEVIDIIKNIGIFHLPNVER